MNEASEKPDWWVANEELRDFLGLPAYMPPRFVDGTFTHDVIPELEHRHNCKIRIMGINVEYLEDWDVRINNEVAFSIGHGRDENGNTVYDIHSDQFVERVQKHV